MTDVENNEISVKSLMNSKSMSKSMAQRIQDADKDRNGTLSIEEVIEIMQSEKDAVKERRLFLRIMIGMAVGLVLLAAAVAGMTYGIVELSKDVNDDNGVLTSKSTGEAMATANAAEGMQLTELWMADSSSIQNMEKMSIDNEFGGIDVYWVDYISLNPGVSATVNTTSGKSFYIDEQGIFEEGSIGSTGRRLSCSGLDLGCLGSQLWGSATSTFNSITDKIAANIQLFYNNITGSFTSIQKAGQGAVKSITTGFNDFTKTLTDLSPNGCDVGAAVANGITNQDNPCCKPASSLNTLTSSITASTNAFKTNLTYVQTLGPIAGVGPCYSLFSKANKTLTWYAGNITAKMNTSTGETGSGSGSINDLLTALPALTNFVACKCTDCCKNLQKAPQALNQSLTDLGGLVNVIGNQCITYIDAITASKKR